MKLRYLFGTTMILALAPGAAGAQAREAVDRVVAVVGKTVILKSELEQQRFVNYPNFPDTGAGIPKQLYRDLLDELIDTELAVAEAEKDTTIRVDEGQVSFLVEQYMRFVKRGQTPEQFKAQLAITGFRTEEELRAFYANNQRRKLRVQGFQLRLQQQGKLTELPPTEAEIKAEYDRVIGLAKLLNDPRMLNAPASVQFKQITVVPKPSAAAKARAMALADSLLKVIRAGGDFAQLAKKFSHDFESRAEGGDLGWRPRGAFPFGPEFERALFTLKAGQVSDPVETRHGIHLIQAVRVRPNQTQILSRHILIRVIPDTVEIAAAEALAGRIAEMLEAGASFDSLQEIHNDGTESMRALTFRGDTLRLISKQYADVVDSLEVGETSGVLPVLDPAGPRFAVVKVLRRVAGGGTVQLADLRANLVESLRRELPWRAYVASLRKANYVEVKDL